MKYFPFANYLFELISQITLFHFVSFCKLQKALSGTMTKQLPCFPMTQEEKKSHSNFRNSQSDKYVPTAGQIKTLCKNEEKLNCTNKVKVCRQWGNGQR